MNKKADKKVYLKDREVAAKKARKVMGGSPKLILAVADGEHAAPGGSIPTGSVVFKVDGNSAATERGIIAI